MSDIFLTEEHELQVQSYLRFAKLKRDQHVRETVSVINEFKSDHFTPGVCSPPTRTPLARYGAGLALPPIHAPPRAHPGGDALGEW